MMLHFLLLVTLFVPPQKNLIVNPGFEQLEAAAPSGWSVIVPPHAGSCEWSVDNNEYHSGSRSFKISRIWIYPRRPARITVSDPIPIHAKKKYILSFWYKTADIVEYALPFSANFTVERKDSPSVRYRKLVPESEEWRPWYILLDNIPHDAHQLSVSFETLVNTKGSIWVDDVSLRVATRDDVLAFEQWRRQDAPQPCGHATEKSSNSKQFFRIERWEDRWWLAGPDGNLTWMMAIAGTRHPKYNRREGAQPVPKEENQRMYSIFMEECGFNSFAGWTAGEYALISKERHREGKHYLPFTKVLGLATAVRDSSVFARDRNGTVLSGGHAFPDPFNPLWRQKAREKAERLISGYRDDPSFLGWYVDNEIDFGELFRYVWSADASREFVQGLEAKYKSIKALNTAWSSPFRVFEYVSFDDVIADKPEPRNWDDPLWVDFAAFERRMLSEYINYTCDLVRELDPNHLVISNRINLNPMPELHRTIDLWGKYDIVCMNIYPDNNTIGFNSGELAIMKRLHEGTGRPVLIGEWSVPAVDSGLYGFGKDSLDRPLDWSWPQVVRTQKERGEVYEICMKQLASLDFMLGAGWFITFDIDNVQRRANRGIMNLDYTLYEDLVRAMKKTHSEIRSEMGIAW